MDWLGFGVGWVAGGVGDILAFLAIRFLLVVFEVSKWLIVRPLAAYVHGLDKGIQAACGEVVPGAPIPCHLFGVTIGMLGTMTIVVLCAFLGVWYCGICDEGLPVSREEHRPSPPVSPLPPPRGAGPATRKSARLQRAM